MSDGEIPTLTALLTGLTTDPDQTAENWRKSFGGGIDPFLEIDWAQVCLLALQHRVEGLLAAGLRASGAQEATPVSVLSALGRRSELAEVRYTACYDVLRELERREPGLVHDLVFFKGAHLATLYDSPAQRMVGDFDFIVAGERLEQLRGLFLSLDFWEKPGKNGPTFFGPALDPQLGSTRVVFDVHLDAPPKYNRTGQSTGAVWRSSAERMLLGEVPCLRLPRELELLEVLVHATEHAGSWLHVCLDDDVRLIRHLDVELLCASGEVDGSRVGELARQLGLTGELAVGLAMQRALRGALPAALEPLTAWADAAADLVDVIALPEGGTVTWDEPLDSRAFRTDRSTRALAMMPAGSRRRDEWFDWRKGLVRGQEDVAQIAGQASERLSDVLPGRTG
ncbi:nucleotidyltransferase family protein [Streptomyces sp. NPDC014685]|uniref:nucleotidyltransferase family protein n=1 Tax=Streptomyces sp. NPDC014685 TaxID=3364881 RepID=UPI0036FB2EB4